MKSKFSNLKKTRINLSESLPLYLPLSIDFELTNRCNFKCKFCPESLKNYENEVGGDLITANWIFFQKCARIF